MLFHLGIHGQSLRQSELFCGAELFYADINFLRLYDIKVNLTPGVKLHFKHDWQLTGQMLIPVVNYGYPDRDNMIRLSMANVSKEFHFSRAKQHLKITTGLFGQDRCGGDVRWACPVTKWLMFNMRLGATTKWGLGFDFKKNTEAEIINNDWAAFGIVGANIWLDKWNTEFRASGGRYLYGDYGMEGEIARHFNHCSITAFMQFHEASTTTGGTNRLSGGFRIVMMIPPYKKYDRKLVVRPASNFRLTYNAQSDKKAMKRYRTDPEENERTNAIPISWGTDKFEE